MWSNSAKEVSRPQTRKDTEYEWYRFVFRDEAVIVLLTDTISGQRCRGSTQHSAEASLCSREGANSDKGLVLAGLLSSFGYAAPDFDRGQIGWALRR